MDAKHILTTMQALTTLGTLEAKVKESEETVRALLRQVDALEQANRRQQETLDNIFKKTICPQCALYLQSKGEGDTVEGRKCDRVFLQRCFGLGQ